ncbi:MAG: hypothetical protein J6P05_01255 [Lachnospiraceae bacterium]|nr:hypothetical protein [Lachnospiraceae bacterium]
MKKFAFQDSFVKAACLVLIVILSAFWGSLFEKVQASDSTASMNEKGPIAESELSPEPDLDPSQVDLNRDYALTPEEEEELERALKEREQDFVPTISLDEIQIESSESPTLSYSYDEENARYVYQLPNLATFYMTAPLGAMSNYAVSLEMGEDAYIADFAQDGTLYSDSDPNRDRLNQVFDLATYLEGGYDREKEEDMEAAIEAAVNQEEMLSLNAEDSGNYAFRLISETRNGMKNVVYDVYGSFQILTPKTPVAMSLMNAPFGYEFSEVRCNGRKLPISNPRWTYLEQDGEYTVLFKPIGGASLPDYDVSFVRDTTPPALYFTNPIEKNPVEGPVSYYLKDGTAGIRVYWNSQLLAEPIFTATATGRYVVVAYDRLGNESEYEFEIENKRGMPLWQYLVILVILIAAALLVIIFSHRSMRII